MKILTKAGRVTSYGMACGYLDISETTPRGIVAIHKPSPSFYGYEVYVRDGLAEYRGRVYYTGGSLKEARKAARAATAELKAGVVK